MYLEYHYVIAVILLSALIAGLLVRWRYKKQADDHEWSLNSEKDAHRFDLEDRDRQIKSLNVTLNEQAAVLEKAQAYNEQSESQVRHFQKTASILKDDLAVEKTKHKVTLNEKDDAIFELNTLNNDRGVVIENYAKDIARMQIVMDGLKEREKNLTGYKDLFLAERRKTDGLKREKNVLDGQIATQRKVIKEAKDATEEAITMIDGLHFQIAAFKGKPVATEKLKAVVRED